MAMVWPWCTLLSLQEVERHKDKGLSFLTKCSFLEIYNDRITDLLKPTSTNLLVLHLHLGSFEICKGLFFVRAGCC